MCQLSRATLVESETVSAEFKAIAVLPANPTDIPATLYQYAPLSYVAVLGDDVPANKTRVLATAASTSVVLSMEVMAPSNVY